MQAFHGTAQPISHDDLKAANLTPSDAGSFGSGIYLADEKGAQAYAEADTEGCVYRFEVDTTNFLTVSVQFEIAEQFDLDTAALPLLIKLYGVTSDDAADIYNEYTTDGFLLGKAIEEKVKSLGYAGLVLDYGNCFEVVVYNTESLSYRAE
jgi:hypothetical protein